ncbi:hypothetical protein [Hydrogenivirga sp. 128-5-R1-1]|uniref:hypothetical protein n=1 Tax=Hydrogenivirga sp. 128-5-R1-1 TaxID=392423 RepID=UPI00015F0638|nr:hypothetical protein [Hydrogenivirga sp. 128-5-R1-1]EDP73937.1 biotin synthetase [Hydrogenivirga sp. 128-5-R1-1]
MNILNNLAERVINGEKISKEEGLKILQLPDDMVMDLVEEASKIREYFFKNEMEFCSLINAKMEDALKTAHFAPVI